MSKTKLGFLKPPTKKELIEKKVRLITEKDYLLGIDMPALWKSFKDLSAFQKVKVTASALVIPALLGTIASILAPVTLVLAAFNVITPASFFLAPRYLFNKYDKANRPSYEQKLSHLKEAIDSIPPEKKEAFFEAMNKVVGPEFLENEDLLEVISEQYTDDDELQDFLNDLGKEVKKNDYPFVFQKSRNYDNCKKANLLSKMDEVNKAIEENGYEVTINKEGIAGIKQIAGVKDIKPHSIPELEGSIYSNALTALQKTFLNPDEKLKSIGKIALVILVGIIVASITSPLHALFGFGSVASVAATIGAVAYVTKKLTQSAYDKVQVDDFEKVEEKAKAKAPEKEKGKEKEKISEQSNAVVNQRPDTESQAKPTRRTSVTSVALAPLEQGTATNPQVAPEEVLETHTSRSRRSASVG